MGLETRELQWETELTSLVGVCMSWGSEDWDNAGCERSGGELNVQMLELALTGESSSGGERVSVGENGFALALRARVGTGPDMHSRAALAWWCCRGDGPGLPAGGWGRGTACGGGTVCGGGGV